MNYPGEILPNPNYKLINRDLSGYAVIRYINTRDVSQIWDSETNKIVIQCICSPKERIDDLSMSLFGIYSLDHIFIDFTDQGKAKYLKYCSPDIDSEIPIYNLEFILNNDRHYWWIPVEKLHNIPFPYSRSNEPHVAICTVCHTPMRWNYWHFSLRWETDLGALEGVEDKLRKKVATRIGHAARVLIAHYASIQVPKAQQLDIKDYTKN